MTFNVTTHNVMIVLSHHTEVKADGIKELLRQYNVKTDWKPRQSLLKGEVLTTTPPKSVSVTVIQLM